MTDFENHTHHDGFTFKVWRGERMCMLGFDVVAPEPDLVGFAIEFKPPGSSTWFELKNRMAFDYGGTPIATAVTGEKKFASSKAPFQKFRWVHFPEDVVAGDYRYRATKIHMPSDGTLTRGTALELPISLDPVTYGGFLDVGFTRNFASSQAYADKYKNRTDVIPATGKSGLTFTKQAGDVYDWLGFEAHALMFGFLDEAIADPTITLDVFAYDLDEPDLVDRLARMGKRLRIIVDDSTEKDKNGVVKGHGIPSSDESRAASKLRKSAGIAAVKRTHFHNLQHHKVLIARRNGVAFKVLAGSTNFSFRGLYIQANNVLVFHSPGVAGLFAKVFDAAFRDPSGFAGDALAAKWHQVTASDVPNVHLCFSPHKESDLSLNPVRGAIDLATSSVLYSVAFLNQLRSGPTKEAFDRLMTKDLFSYGLVDKKGKLEVKKPDGSVGLVDFAYLAANAPEPFKTEWSGGAGINIHHKFVVTDFALPTAKVFTGSSNLAPSGEAGNGDHLIMIEDRKVAQAYAVEAVRVFDHLHFRSNMKAALEGDPASAPTKLTLRKPTAISKKPAWFERYYAAGETQLIRDRMLFAGTAT